MIREATAERVSEHFREVCRGRVERFELPNILALNFILHDSLGGGGTESLKNDAQGKTHAQGLLQMEVELPEELVAGEADERRRAWEGLEVRREGDSSGSP